MESISPSSKFNIAYLTRDKSIGVTVAAALKEEANKLATRF